jgi:hypothetical protein
VQEVKSLLIGVVGVLLCSSYLFSTQCGAEDFRSPRTQALGGAGHAAPLLNDAIYMDPSYSSFLPTYSLSGNWDWYSFDNDAYTGRLWNASIQDGRSDLFQAGLGYTHLEQGSLINFGASKAAIKQLGFGLGAKVFLPAGVSDRVSNMSFSTAFLATTWFQTSFLADNLIQTADSMNYGFYREFTIGTKFNLQNMLFVYIDPNMTPSAPTTDGSHFGYESGVELEVFDDFFLRGGFYSNSKIPSLNTRGNGWGTGFGWMGPRLSLDYAYSQVSSPMTDTENTIGTTIFF